MHLLFWKPGVQVQLSCFQGHMVPFPCGVQLRSRSVSGRNPICALGHQGRMFVKQGNLLLVRSLFLILLACCKGCRFLLEQPGSSCMALHPRWGWFIDRVSATWLCLSLYAVYAAWVVMLLTDRSLGLARAVVHGLL